MNNDRRSFIRTAGLAVTAAVAASPAVADSDTESLRHKLGLLEDSSALRDLQQRYFTLAQQRSSELAGLFADGVVDVYPATLLDVRVDASEVDVAPDRQRATATLHARVLLATPVSGKGTLQQMARLQGQTEHQWSESGIYTASYVKRGAEWKIAALAYRKA